MKRAIFPALACLLVIVTLFLSSCSTEKYECRCNCADCLCMPSDHIFSIPTRYLFNIAITDSCGEVVPLYGEDMEKAVEILNAFVPESEREYPYGSVLGGHDVIRISYYDAWRTFGITDSSIILIPSLYDRASVGTSPDRRNRTCIEYIGKPGCLQGLIDLFENGEKMPDPYVEEEEKAGSLR